MIIRDYFRKNASTNEHLSTVLVDGSITQLPSALVIIFDTFLAIRCYWLSKNMIRRGKKYGRLSFVITIQLQTTSYRQTHDSYIIDIRFHRQNLRKSCKIKLISGQIHSTSTIVSLRKRNKYYISTTNKSYTTARFTNISFR